MKKLLITTLIVVFLAVATPASATFIDNGDGTVTDDVTGLMWIRNDDSTPQGKDAACAYCEDLVFAGYEDWRAPTIEELQTTIDYRCPVLVQHSIAEYSQFRLGYLHFKRNRR